jgi:hypothetical protein
VWELEEEEGVEVLDEMDCSRSLERDGSEWIGIGGVESRVGVKTEDLWYPV